MVTGAKQNRKFIHVREIIHPRQVNVLVIELGNAGLKCLISFPPPRLMEALLRLTNI